MGIFNIFKKKSSTKSQNDRDLIAANAVALESIVAITESEELKAELSSLKEKVKYTTALTEDKAYSLDKKISGVIGDLKIEVTKNKGDEKSSAKIDNLVRELKALVSERNALV